MKLRTLSIATLLAAFWSGALSAQDLPSATRLQLATKSMSISQYGITWTFDKNYQTGQFVNGDYWVVGPVKIVGITPGSKVLSNGRVVNGSMLNPAIGISQGYDSRIAGTSLDAEYSASLNVGRPNGKDLSASNPLVISKPASLITGVSYTNHPADETNQVHLMAVLTVLDSVPPSDAFRPPYVGADKSIRHTAGELRYDLLPKLKVPASVTEIPDVAVTAAKFQKVWPEHIANWLKERFYPQDNLPSYGREIAGLVSDAALLLVINETDSAKKLLALRLVQIGLDYYEIVHQPNGNIIWKADGGHHVGRNFPLLLAGYLLQDQAMMRVMDKSGQYGYSNGYYEGNPPPDYIHFSESDQFFYVTARDVARSKGYSSADIGLPEYGIEHMSEPQLDNATWNAGYRGVVSVGLSGYVLASRIMGIKDLYNQPVLFDYMDRWMKLGYPEIGRAYNEFQDTMWTAFRSKY